MLEITDCGRTLAGDFVAFDIRWESESSAPDTATWSMAITEGEGSETVHLVYERRDGEFVAQYVDDTATGDRRDVDDDADLRDHEITVRFRADVVGVAVEWPVWKASLAVPGQQTATAVVTL
jgi:hypothetical protein